MQIDLTSVVARSTDVVHSDTENGMTMMNVRSGGFFTLSSVGARIWSLLEEPRSVGRLCDLLLTEFEVERERCEREVLRLAQQMAEEGVVTVGGDG